MRFIAFPYLTIQQNKVIIQTLSRGTSLLYEAKKHQEFQSILLSIRDDINRSPDERLMSAYLLLEMSIITEETILRSIPTFLYILPPLITEGNEVFICNPFRFKKSYCERIWKVSRTRLRY